MSITPEQVPKAVADLRSVFMSEKTRSKEWRVRQLNQMQKMLTEGRERLCEAMNKDLHKSMFEGYMTEISMVEMEIAHVLEHLDEHMEPEGRFTNLANTPTYKSQIRNDPLGVVLVMGAWNYNVVLTLTPLVGAIGAGNTVLVKPGNYSLNSTLEMQKLIAEYLDNDAIKCVTGNRDVNAICLEQRYDLIFVTGSTLIGKLVARAAAEHLTPIVLELGGKSPCIVDKSCDLSVSASRLLHGALLNAGQTCVRPDYLLVHEDVADAFIKEMKAKIRQFFGETDADQRQTEWLGRIVNDKSFKRISALVEAEKGRIVYGGNVDAATKYIQPTIFDFKHDWEAFSSSDIMADEVFGPLLPVMRWKNLEDCVQFIRTREKPLALYVYGSDSTVYEEILNRTFSGSACVNDSCTQLSNADIPFGGVGNSGMGNYHGNHSLKTFSHQRAVMIRPTFGDVPVRYPPYAQWEQSALQLLLWPVWSTTWDKAMRLISDKKNLAIGALLAYVVKHQISSRL